jgi:hypothetical protein
MKNILHFITIIVFTIVIHSCSDNKKEGDWDDNIKLSTRTVDFNASGDSVTIKTGGSWWWITDISVDTIYYYGFTGVDLQSDNYMIKQNCFNVERRGKNTLFIKVDANTLNVSRIITVGLEAGDYFDRVKITQEAK